jgi:chemotaxis signal transduction protein
MAIYLQVRTGPVQLLVDALGVHEVLSLDGLQEGGQGHIEWRDQVLQAVPMHQFLGQPSGECLMAVVYSAGQEDEPPLLLQVDEVVGLRTISATDWLQMPRLPDATAVFFDALIDNPNSPAQVYRLRRPLANALFKPELTTG